ncbi:hypothetical protein EYB26_007510 [Talaromyces marneffei]|uniref:uncharacterized protein n=1 Tax=Talaromyces marneffei TaxID=37727 RepID=UPI0012A840B2|nr:uncharacterized protein EYB26_007510 [Talaromyces marneffei]QGA19815.1 hypothetical protein EYB26_007510 [Talaromyces marneffei]
MTATPAILPQWRDLPVYWDWNFRLLICESCGFALGPNQASSHFWEKHQVSVEQRHGLTEYLRQHDFQEPASVAPRPRGASEHPALRTYNGLACRLCETYYTINLDNLLKHLRHQHPDRPRSSRRAVDQLYDDVYLQTWNRQLYWIISRGGRTLRLAQERSTYDHLQALQERERTRHAAIQAATVQDSGIATRSFESLRPWIERTGWEQTYDGLHRDLLRRLTEMPLLYDSCQDHRLWSSPGEADLVSPAADERVIWRIAHAVDSMLDRCEETMRHTGRPILCWLRTLQLSPYYPKPFVFLARSASTSRYRRIWKRFIVFLFRCFRLGAEVCRTRLRIKFRRKQWDVIRLIWTFASDCSVSSSLGPEPLHPRSRRSQQWDDHVDSMSGSDAAGESSKDDLDEEWDQPDDTESDSEDVTTDDLDNEAREGAGAAESTNHLSTDLLPPPSLEKLFQLNIIFLTDEFTDGQPLSSLLVYFSRILGFSPDAQSFQPAKSFTPHLSALIYIQQLLFLEYALPYRDYPMIGWNRRPRRYHLDRLNPIRSRYMIAGALTPLAEF